jgi:hypothetical protein
MEQDYFAVLKLDNVLTRLTTTMGLVAHAWAAPMPFYHSLSNSLKQRNAILLPIPI